MSVYYYNLFNDVNTGRNTELKTYLENNLGEIKDYTIKEIVRYMINNWNEVEKWV